MSRPATVSDQTVTTILAGYAGLVHRVPTDPQHWLGLDDDPPPTAPVLLRVLGAVRDRTFGETTPASPRWGELPQRKRVDWWLRRITISAGLAPRLAGAVVDRIPLRAGLSASASGLAVCATAHEHVLSDAAGWVPLLAKVLLNRDLTPNEVDVRGPAAAEASLADAAAQAPATPDAADLGTAARRAAGTVWRLAREFRGLSSLLGERPRGPRLFRVLGKVPAVGLPAGWLDERGGIRRAAKQTEKLLIR